MMTLTKKLLGLIAAIAAFAGCEMLGPDFLLNGDTTKDDVEITPTDTMYLMQDNIEPFESVFVNKDGFCIAIKKDTTYAYIAVIDSLKKEDSDALIAYIDESGNIRRLYKKGKFLNIAYNDDSSINLRYCDEDGTDEFFQDIEYTRHETKTKAGTVLNPMDFVSVLATLGGISSIGDAVACSPKIGEAAKALMVADLLTTGKFSNTSTEILTGISSVAIAAAIGTNVPVAILLAAINTSYAAIQDWQNNVADSYFGSARPVTGDTVQLTDEYFVISYSITDVNSWKTNFNVGVIVADGWFVTKNHHLYKKSVPYTSDNGRIIINIGSLNPKKGDRFKYRIFLESATDNGFKWDDMMLDYWRYGAVNNIEIGEPALKIKGTKQTDAEDNNGHNYIFDFDVTASNEIPFDVDEWGVAIYETFSETCTSGDEMKDSESVSGQGSKTMSFTVNISEVMMNTETKPYTPIINYFAVPYVSFDGHTHELFDSAVKVKLEYPNSGQWVDLGLSSGIKWAAWNVGATVPEEYGGYYAWGETEEKNVYSIETYKYAYSSNDVWYFKNIGNCISGTSYDVATVKWGDGARMPTLDEIKELINECKWESGNLNGVAGVFVTGPNGNNIFIPFAGYRYDSDLYYEGDGGCLWSGTRYEDYDCYAYDLYCNRDSVDWDDYWGRYGGLSVRPVSD